jgi:S-formylglutathione hydrolase FrmB
VRGSLLGLAAALAVMLCAQAAAAQPPGFKDAHAIHVVSQQFLDPRLVALTVTTPALATPANVRILLPSGYAEHPRRRYPVLYLLHGTSGGAADWTKMGDAEQTTAGLPLIVVMPDIAINDDGGGWCTNWYNSGRYGQPEWETFHIGELIPWVDHNLRTIASREERAIAGLSQGGFCSMSYPARHPDLFSTALAYSGAPDIAYDSEAQALVTPIINATEVGLDGVPANSMFGPRTTEEINWAAHDPTTLANNLRGMNLLMYFGNGKSGPLDQGAPNPGAMAIESGVYQLNVLFHNRLQALGIPSVYDPYGDGTHSWPYWARDLRWSIGPLMNDFAHPPPTPKRITYMSADMRYVVFGWRVTMHRKVEEFSTLVNARPGGFTLEGSGSATVITPARYRHGAVYRVTIRGHGGKRVHKLRANRHGQLKIQVPLGPSDTVQEYSIDGSTAGTTVFTTTVKIGR